MSTRRRWALFGIGVLLLVATPFLVSARPVPQQDISATRLAALISDSEDVPYTGLVESRGRIGLPNEGAVSGLSTVANLFGTTTRVRVWWAAPGEWRTATLRTTGETDLIHHESKTVRWVYESKRVTTSPDVPIRLPNSSDVLPPVLAERLLAGARPSELSRLPSIRVAGRVATGLRLTPSDEQASVAHVDVWADAESGLPLRVDLVGDSGPPAFTSEFTEVSYEKPSAEVLTFRAPPDASVHFDDTVDLAAAADRYADRTVPDALAGLARRVDDTRSVGLYGRGPTWLLALPLREDDARRLTVQLEKRPGAICSPGGWYVASGPVHVMVTAPDFTFGSWLLAGTVTAEAITTAGRQLREQFDVFIGNLGGDFFRPRPPRMDCS